MKKATTTFLSTIIFLVSKINDPGLLAFISNYPNIDYLHIPHHMKKFFIY